MKPNRHAIHNFNLDAPSLYKNYPTSSNQFYVAINFSTDSTVKKYVDSFLTSVELSHIAPLVKSVTLPELTTKVTALDQYGRIRNFYKKIEFGNIILDLYDVVDGKIQKFCDMYNRYYFMDLCEPGINEPYSTYIDPETGVRTTNKSSPAKKSDNKIIVDNLENHKFGYNLNAVQNTGNLISTIDIYQVHAGRFNRTTIVNPKISGVKRGKGLSYDASTEAMITTLTFAYEYVYYTIQNLELGGVEVQNNSSTEFFDYGEFLDPPKFGNGVVNEFTETNNPVVGSSNNIFSNIGNNAQGVTSSITSTEFSDFSNLANSTFGNADFVSIDTSNTLNYSTLASFGDTYSVAENVNFFPATQTKSIKSNSNTVSNGMPSTPEKQIQKYSSDATTITKRITSEPEIETRSFARNSINSALSGYTLG